MVLPCSCELLGKTLISLKRKFCNNEMFQTLCKCEQEINDHFEKHYPNKLPENELAQTS